MITFNGSPLQGGSMEKLERPADESAPKKKVKLEIKRLEKVETTGLREGG
jgi:hypothetical protein